MADLPPTPRTLQSLPHGNKSNDPSKSTALPKYCILDCFSTLQGAVTPKVAAVSQNLIKIQIE